ncbi:MAG: methyltransferase domain-containing protein [Solirubrobacterales bacterium]
MNGAAYDRIGLDYSAIRRADPRIEALIWAALGDAKTVLNIGAGAGSYEPADREVIAIEPSAVMIAQRPPEAAAAIQGVAESLPLKDKSVDATMGVFTMQHWQDIGQGLEEVRRVTRERVALLTLDMDIAAKAFWLARDYLPEMIEPDRRDFPTMELLRAKFPALELETVAVPNDCSDGFCIALWSRPEAHLDPRVRKASSIWHRVPGAAVQRALAKLASDLDSGEWDRRYGHLRGQAELDIGMRLVRADI